MTVLMALSSIEIEQSKGTEINMEKAMQLLEYLASNPDAKVRLHASNMVMNVHSKASYLSESKALSRACRHFFLGRQPQNGRPIWLNGPLFTLCAILHLVVSSAVEAEL
jgi:hypothetical protein